MKTETILSNEWKTCVRHMTEASHTACVRARVCGDGFVRAGVVACLHARPRRVAHTSRHSRRACAALRAARVRPWGQPRTRAFRKRMTAQASTPCASVNSTTMKYGLCGNAHKYLKGKRYAQGYSGYSHQRAEPWSTGLGNLHRERRAQAVLPSIAWTTRAPHLQSAPGLAQHLRRDSPTSAPGLAHICAGTYRMSAKLHT
jgi:hypothetical protein